MKLSNQQLELVIRGMQCLVSELHRDMAEVSFYGEPDNAKASMMHDLAEAMDIITLLDRGQHVSIRMPPEEEETPPDLLVDPFDNWEPNDPKNW